MLARVVVMRCPHATSVSALAQGIAHTAGTLGLSNSGDTVTLCNADGVTLDTMTYTDTPDGTSLCRTNEKIGEPSPPHTNSHSTPISPGT